MQFNKRYWVWNKETSFCIFMLIICAGAIYLISQAWLHLILHVVGAGVADATLKFGHAFSLRKFEIHKFEFCVNMRVK